MSEDKSGSLAPQSRSLPVFAPVIMGDLTFASPTTQLTIGAAGAASALPASPTGYLVINLGNAAYGVPFYALS